MKRFIIFIYFIVFFAKIYAVEGLWVPKYLKQTCYNDMLKQGLLLPEDSIYSENHASLKDAVVSFGGGATGVIVSENGLLLTNHHCGYRYIQNHSSINNNLLENGFWAQSQTQELPNDGLFVKILVKMEDVTDSILNGVSSDSSESIRANKIKQNVANYLNTLGCNKDKFHECVIKPLYEGNKYFIYYYDIYYDVRLVGAPPMSIGKYGGELDDWMWPRYTGDFSIFRIYANKENQPTDYSINNIPFHPKKYVLISKEGLEDGAFVFIMGYPGSSYHNVTSYDMDMMVNTTYLQRISLYTKQRDILQRYMHNDAQLSIDLSSRLAGLNNTLKQLLGVVDGINRIHGIEMKKVKEREFMEKLSHSNTNKQKYASLMNNFEQCEKDAHQYITAFEYWKGIQSIALINQANKINSIVNESTNTAIKELLKISNFYQTFYPEVDKDIFVEMFSTYLENVPKEFHPQLFDKYFPCSDSIRPFAEKLYKSSVIASKSRLENIIANDSINQLKNDEVILIINDLNNTFNQKIWPFLPVISSKLDSLNRLYTKAISQLYPEREIYPDANQTLRISYGKKEGYLSNNMYYPSTTYLKGMIEKMKIGLPEYSIPEKLIQLCQNNKYLSLPVCFITTAHTSSGSSGSPVFNGRGKLVGLNFDRNWEGTMSDILYDVNICRNIAVDIHYILFIIDKFAENNYILNELNSANNGKNITK